MTDRLYAERLGMPFLLYEDGAGNEQVYMLEDTASRKITVGRAPAADVLLTWDSKISGVHAELERIGDGWAIADDGLSRNGTFVNEERLQGRHRLEHGDNLRFGDTIVRYHAPEHREYGETVVSPS
jgi:pSer/pThr/pTyr-binding forkhead associated (FHA) protein